MRSGRHQAACLERVVRGTGVHAAGDLLLGHRGELPAQTVGGPEHGRDVLAVVPEEEAEQDDALLLFDEVDRNLSVSLRRSHVIGDNLRAVKPGSPEAAFRPSLSLNRSTRKPSKPAFFRAKRYSDSYMPNRQGPFPEGMKKAAREWSK